MVNLAPDCRGEHGGRQSDAQRRGQSDHVLCGGGGGGNTHRRDDQSGHVPSAELGAGMAKARWAMAPYLSLYSRSNEGLTAEAISAPARGRRSGIDPIVAGQRCPIRTLLAQRLEEWMREAERVPRVSARALRDGPPPSGRFAWATALSGAAEEHPESVAVPHQNSFDALLQLATTNNPRYAPQCTRACFAEIHPQGNTRSATFTAAFSASAVWRSRARPARNRLTTKRLRNACAHSDPRARSDQIVRSCSPRISLAQRARSTTTRCMNGTWVQRAIGKEVLVLAGLAVVCFEHIWLRRRGDEVMR